MSTRPKIRARRQEKMDEETFREFGHEMVDWIADYFAGVEE